MPNYSYTRIAPETSAPAMAPSVPTYRSPHQSIGCPACLRDGEATVTTDIAKGATFAGLLLLGGIVWLAMSSRKRT